MFFHFQPGPGIFLRALVLGQNGLKTSESQFPARWGLKLKNGECKKLRNFGEKLLTPEDFFPKSASSTGNLCFPTSGISLSAQG